MATASKSRFRWLIWLAAILLVVFVGIQFIPAELPKSAVKAEPQLVAAQPQLQAPANVKAVLKNSCYNCHSNETKLAWFDEVAPPYWLVAHDVKEARSHLNFSEIAKLPETQQKAQLKTSLFEAVYMVQMGAMPLPSYVKAHSGVAVTPKQLEVLRNYLAHLPETPPAVDTAVETPANVQKEFNGVEFMPDYRNWKAISSTERWDNGTMREILGNEIAIEAIAENRINPWPNGTAFAKVAWLQTPPDDKGVVRTGAFKQVEFMIKDAEKYAATGGWGWGRWLGMGLKPYGNNAAFQNECVTCHAPLRKNDYVFTMPIAGGAGGAMMPRVNHLLSAALLMVLTGCPDNANPRLATTLNYDAALTGELAEKNPMQDKVITSWINTKDQTMSTLFGNDTAVKFARANASSSYPEGSVLSLVTWSQVEDPRWFGANIPEKPRSVEVVRVTENSYIYQLYMGSPLKQIANEKSASPGDRATELLSEHAAEMPGPIDAAGNKAARK